MQTFAQIQTEIADMLALADDELDPEQLRLLDDYLDGLANMEADKVDAFGQFLKLQAARAEACKEESRRLAAKAKAAEKRIAYLKEIYTESMRRHGLRKISGHAYTLSVRKSESVAVTGRLDEIPDLYKRTQITVEPEKALIREALKDGIAVPGCALVESFNLEIR